MDDLITRLTSVVARRPPSTLMPGSGSNSNLSNGSGYLPMGDKPASSSMFSKDDGALPIGDKAYSAYSSVGTLFAIINQLANAVATTEWHLYRRTSTRDKNRRQEVLNHGFTTVWDMPNPFMTGRYFREACQQHMDLVGETIIVLIIIGGLIIEMWPVRPDRIKPVKHPTKFLTGWIYIGPDGEEVPLELDQVIQIKYPNPSDPYRGMSPVCTMLTDVEAAKYAAEWNRNFFINGAQPGGVITIDYQMNDKEWESFNRRWRSQHQGVANAHRVAVLERAKWQDTKFSMEDMQFTELRNLPRELIREAFAFPKPMLGTVDDVNRANSDAAKEIMAEQHTEPRLSRWRDVINVKLLPRFANGKTLVLDYDDPTPINHEAADRERNSKATAATALRTGGWHPDDILEAMELPAMRYIGPPAAATSTSPAQEGAEENV